MHSLDHFSLTVPDLDKAKTFYETFGLDVRKDGNGIALHTHGHPHRWGTLSEGPKKKLHYLSFGAFEDDLPRFREHLNKLGIERLDPPAGFESNGLWFRDHEGVPVEIRVAEKSSPNAKSVFSVVSGAARRRQPPSSAAKRRPHSRGGSRTFCSSPTMCRARSSSTPGSWGCGCRTRSEGNIAFLHGVHGSDHHLIAFARSEGSGLHHCSWDVGSVEDIGLGAMQMAGKGFTHGWGLGRHVLGSNYFHYIQDPWGSWSEYSADIDFVPSTVDWEAADHLGEDFLLSLGPERARGLRPQSRSRNCACPGKVGTGFPIGTCANELRGRAGDQGKRDASKRNQVLIVGAGPVGLALAIELGLRGIDVTIVEQRSRTGAQPRAKTTNVRTMQHMRRWGLAEKLRAAAPLPYDYPTDIVFSTTLYGRTLAVIENAFAGAEMPRSALPRAGAMGAAIYRRANSARAHRRAALGAPDVRHGARRGFAIGRTA